MPRLHQPPPAARAAPPAAGLVGRDGEIEALEQRRLAAVRGTPSAVCLLGEAGAGKSLLLEALAGRAEHEGMTVLRCSGAEEERNLAFAGLLGLLRPLVGHVDQLPGHQAASLRSALALGPPSAPDLFAVAAATLTLISAAAAQSPVACLVDDLHVLDPSSRTALLFAARRLREDAVLVVLTARPEEIPPQALDGLVPLVLGGLGPGDALALLAAHGLPALHPAVLAEVVGSTRGNPLALIEVAGALSPRQRLGVDPVGEILPVGPLVERSAGRRLDALPERTRRALLVAALAEADDPASLARALALLELGHEDLAEAETAGLVSLSPHRVEFAHPLTRAAVVRRAGAPEQRCVRRALAEAVGPDGDPERLARHLAGAAQAPSEEVAAAIEQAAGLAAARGALAEASEGFAQAARLSDDRGSRARRLFAAGVSGARAGLDADPLLVQSLEGAEDPALRVQALVTRAVLGAWSGRPEVVEATVATGLDEVRAVSPQAAGVLVGASAMAQVQRFDVQRYRDLAVEAWALSGGRMPDDGQPFGLLPAIAFFTSEVLTGRTVEADPDGLLAGRLAQAVRDMGELDLVFPTSHLLVFADRIPEALEFLGWAEAEARRQGRAAATGWVLCARGWAELRRGALEPARATLLGALELAPLASGPLAASVSLIALGLVEAIMGVDAAASRVQASLELEPIAPAGFLGHHRDKALAMIAVAGDRLPEAAARLEAIRAETDAAGVRFAGLYKVHPELVDVLVRLGREQEAHTVLDELETRRQATPGPWIQAMIARCRGQLAGYDAFDGAFAEALAWHAQHPSALERARTHLAYAERLRRARRLREARAQAREAMALAERCGARPLAERARRELRAADGRPQPAGARDGELTPQEFQIAQQVALGRSNRDAAAALFLSHKTVEMHLTRVYRKLRVRSRAELARRFAELFAPTAVQASAPEG